MKSYEKPEIIEIEEKVYCDLKFVTFSNIQSIMKSIETSLESNIMSNEDILFEHPSITAGLYTYAVEEYGKFLILKSYSVCNGLVKIKYKDEFTNHHRKFEVAIKNLPKECISIGKPLFDSGILDPKIFDVEPTIADFESRMSIFYSDLEWDGKMVKLTPFVDSDTLKKAILKFSEVIKSTKLD